MKFQTDHDFSDELAYLLHKLNKARVVVNDAIEEVVKGLELPRGYLKEYTKGVRNLRP